MISLYPNLLHSSLISTKNSFIRLSNEGASAISFEVLSDGYAKDPWNVYYMGQKIEGASAISFQSLGQGMAKDGFHHYYCGQKYNGLTPPMHNFH
ncbi:unnamed protein product [Adineta steineri]|uniref:Uncharacterized protein n=1 Tax=Adineta steineri TaxID=433720 RepID=A0A813VK61_9BILA|nr:unnamed protein product [Adineta steineri]CAF1263891.1 unnamed protein product [Adineta steineri]CAF3957802.1 unnamed protein product [Adineta steineri]CAF4177481.1 unnamed protein product [Adineta steineri]